MVPETIVKKGAGPRPPPNLAAHEGFYCRRRFDGQGIAALSAVMSKWKQPSHTVEPSKLYAAALVMLKAKHSRTHPYTPRTNGKAERFIQTILREWAYARQYTSSARRWPCYSLGTPVQ
jgi:transposase InsO family protein